MTKYRSWKDDIADRWRTRGLSTRAAGALAHLACSNEAELLRLSRDTLASTPNVGPGTLNELLAHQEAVAADRADARAEPREQRPRSRKPRRKPGNQEINR